MTRLYWVWEGGRDLRRLAKVFPGLGSYGEERRRIEQSVRPVYEEYVTSVSVPGAAISLELSVFLMWLCETTRPRRILDLGSGFSSWVLRQYAASATTQTAEVWSVDDSPLWLDRTRAFLVAHNLPADHLETWDSFCGLPRGTFDLIICDLGTLEYRAAALEQVLALGGSPGWIVLDDLHKPSYRAAVAKKLQRHNRQGSPRYVFYSVRALTKDRISVGRYSGLLAGGETEAKAA